MDYTPYEVTEYIREADIKFIRLAFCDVFGTQKNIAIMADELERAFKYGIAIDASAICGFGGEIHSDLLLHPDAASMMLLPWRSENGGVVRMFCSVSDPKGNIIGSDTRSLLKKSVDKANKAGLDFAFGSEMEFYLFTRDQLGQPTKIPYDNAGYMDVAPFDKGENVRREICLGLERMGIRPECAHHEEGPGQNEIDFRYSDPLAAADNAVTFKAVVDTVAARNGLCADFSPKPLKDFAGNGMHINFSVKGGKGESIMAQVNAGILKYIPEMTVFFNRSKESYARLGCSKAPKYISWSSENRSQLIRIPAAVGEYRRSELRSPDPMCNPYLAYTLIIEAGLRGKEDELSLPAPVDVNLFKADEADLAGLRTLPADLKEAKSLARESEFIKGILPETIIAGYCD